MLSTTRQVGFNTGPIPWNCIDQYCTRHDLNLEQYYKYVDFIRALDDAFLEKQKKDKASA